MWLMNVEQHATQHETPALQSSNISAINAPLQQHNCRKFKKHFQQRRKKTQHNIRYNQLRQCKRYSNCVRPVLASKPHIKKN